MEARVLKGFRGWETLECGRHLIHSAYDPQREASTFIQPALKANPDLLLIFGLGLGYHLECIVQKMKRVQVIVFEPSQQVYQIYLQKGRLSHGPKDWLSITTHLEEFNEVFSKRYIYRPGDLSLGLLIFPPYAKLFPEELACFQENLNRMVTRKASNADTIAQKKRLWFENFLENIPHLLESPDITSLSGLFQNIPSFLVGAGPSLSKNVDLLKKANDRALIFSANAAFSRLNQEGVQPQITGVLEGSDVSHHLKGMKGISQTYLAVEACGHPRHFQIESKGRFVFHSQKWSAELLGKSVFLPNGGHVGSAGFTMAVLLGCNPLLLVGQDLTFEGDKVHAKGAEDSSILTENEETVGIPRDERRAIARRSMSAYQMWYEESAAYLRREDPQRILLNATEGGITIPGIPNVSLQEALEKFCRNEFDFEKVLQKRKVQERIDASVPLKKVERLILSLDEFMGKSEGKYSRDQIDEFTGRSRFIEFCFQDVPANNIELIRIRAYLARLKERIQRYPEEGSKK